MIINALYIINNDVDAHAPNPQGGTLWESLKITTFNTILPKYLILSA